MPKCHLGFLKDLGNLIGTDSPTDKRGGAFFAPNNEISLVAERMLTHCQKVYSKIVNRVRYAKLVGRSKNVTLIFSNNKV